jgi:predicted secreted protein
MSVTQMRSILKKQYHGAYKWINRVNKMSDAQVIAVYMRMLEAHTLQH